MKQIFLLLFCVTIITPSQNSFAKTTYGKNWLMCAQDNDCVKIDGVCSRKDVLHKNFMEDFKKFKEYMETVVRCKSVTEEEKKFDEEALPQCLNKKCILAAPKK
jgi:hypothetical protein